MLLMKVLKYRKIAEFPKISIRKFKTFYELKTASCLEKIIDSPPPPPPNPPNKNFLCLCNKNSYIDRFSGKFVSD